jgi:hypothetical protein
MNILKFKQTTESLRTKLAMEPYSESAAQTFKLSSNDNWLRKRQGLALPALPPTTSEARKYFFTKIREFSEVATTEKKKKVNFEAFAREWNRTADGKERFYVTFEVLSAYAKTWEKANNVRASQELMSGQLQEVKKTADIFLATKKPFPSYLTSESTQIQPSRGVIVIEELAVPSSLSTESELSHSYYPAPAAPHPSPTLPNASIHVNTDETSLSNSALNPVTQAIQAPPLQEPESHNPTWYSMVKILILNYLTITVEVFNSLLRISKMNGRGAPNVAAWSLKNNASEQLSVPVAVARKQHVQETATY